MICFESLLTTLELSFIFWGSLGSGKICLSLKKTTWTKFNQAKIVQFRTTHISYNLKIHSNKKMCVYDHKNLRQKLRNYSFSCSEDIRNMSLPIKRNYRQNKQFFPRLIIQRLLKFNVFFEKNLLFIPIFTC